MKQINSREFQKSFAAVIRRLKNGQRIEITKRGKSVGQFIKARRPIKMPDFAANLEGRDPKVGLQILKKYYDGLS